MDKEINTSEKEPLPDGFKIRKKEETNPFPPGFKPRQKLETPRARDEAKLKKEAGVYAAADKTPEELKKMSVRERMQYNEDLKTERQYLTSTQFSKNALSGASFGLSENIEGLKPIEFEETNPYSIIGAAGHTAGSFLPLSKIVSIVQGPAAKLAAKSPVFQRQLSSLLTMFGAGATSKGLETIAKGEIPTADELLEHGVEWAALDAFLQLAGAGGRFAKGLLTRSQATGTSRKDLLNRVTKELSESGIDMSDVEAVTNKALEILEGPLNEAEQQAARKLQLTKEAKPEADKVAQEVFKQEPVTPKDLKTKKITDEPINRLTKESVINSQPYLPGSMNFTFEAETLAKDSITEQLELVGERALSEEELGNSIKEDIETGLASAKKEYRPLYIEAEEAAGVINHVPENTAREAGEKLIEMSQLKTKPAGYESVLKTLENVLEDAGFTIQREGGKATGRIEQIVSSKNVPVRQTIKLAKRLNEIVDYESVEPSVKDALKSVVRAAKKDIREGLKANPNALTAFELAEAEHARVASKYTRESIRKIRGNQAGEKVSKMAEAPSTLSHLKEVLSPKQVQQVERELLEKMNAQTYEKAKKTLRETERHLSDQNRKLAREIVEAKNPHNPVARKKLTQDAILNDMSTAMTNGTRPEKTLNLWKNPKGQKLVKETFHNSPNWPQVKNYLEKQSFNDMVSSVMKDGKLNIKEFKSFMKDPATVNNIRSQGGEEAVTFFRSLDSKVKQFEQNTKLLETLPRIEELKKHATNNKRSLRESFGKKNIEKKAGKVGEETLESLGNRRKEFNKTKETKGAQTLQRAAEKERQLLENLRRKDYPIQAKLEDWKAWIKDALGLNAQAAMTVFGVAKLGGAALGSFTLGIPTTVTTMIGYKIMNKMLTSPRVRQAFQEAAKHQTNSLKFILAVEHLGDVLDEEGI